MMRTNQVIKTTIDAMQASLQQQVSDLGFTTSKVEEVLTQLEKDRSYYDEHFKLINNGDKQTNKTFSIILANQKTLNSKTSRLHKQDLKFLKQIYKQTHELRILRMYFYLKTT